LAAKNTSFPPLISGLILAGGAGRRAGNRDKGLVGWQGRPLVSHVYQHMSRQVDEVLISCNRNLEHYAELGAETFVDQRTDFQGPLAGIEAATPHVRHDFLFIAPCDCPGLPDNLAQRLLQALLNDRQVNIAYARNHGSDHYLCAVLRKDCLSSLGPFLDNGGRAVRHWFKQCGAKAVEFEGPTELFLNINHPPEE
jgi:molybdenum cofactor guanylyltransferase